ncbi:MAG: radical SAM protein [Desulfovibrionaceae bacterium]|nr:radical SAM protein [Desulfovibrionaceae bacterium]MBF0514472.1 radical SAM protein [Desulfovibrionaceae bacterium]
MATRRQGKPAGREERKRPEEFGGRLPVALVFPGEASLALSTLGWQAVYRLLSGHPGLAVERFYVAPEATRLESEESGRDIGLFPVVAFSINFELDLLPLARALKIASLLLPERRRPAFPLVLGGGPLAFLNPAPLARALDLIFCGEAGKEFLELMLAVKEKIQSGADKPALLASVAARPGVYVPGQSPLPVRRVVTIGAPGALPDPAASVFVSSRAQFADMFLIEANRGCPHACRFCAAGFVYRPPRQASLEQIKNAILEAAPRKIGLVGTALTDWPELPVLLAWLGERKIKYGLSSLRADGLTEKLLAILRRSGLRTVTLALEGASQRLRDAANKHLSEETFLRAVRLCAEHGVDHLKIYLIVGWPGETGADYDEFAPLAARVAEVARLAGGGKKSIRHVTVAVSSLVPKPFTPLEFAPMATQAQLETAIERVQAAAAKIKGMRVTHDSPLAARVQGLISRGGEDAFELAALALENGGSWRKALAAWAGDKTFIDREFPEDRPFPWEVIDTGVSRAHLLREWRRYKERLATPACAPADCAGCGACGMDVFVKGRGTGG